MLFLNCTVQGVLNTVSELQCTGVINTVSELYSTGCPKYSF